MFTASRPVWAKGREKDINLHLEFRVELPANSTMVRLTASSAYQLYIDGAFAHYGPARAGDGYFRVDEWDVKEAKRLDIYVAGYYSSCFEYCLYPSFLNLEVLDSMGSALIATGRDYIPCRERAPRLRFTDKQARQRVYTEVYDFTRQYGGDIETAVLPDPKYLPRRVAPFSNAVLLPEKTVCDYSFTAAAPTEEKLREGGAFNRNILYMNHDTATRFDKEECCLFAESHALEFTSPAPAGDEAVIKDGAARMYDFGADYAGLIELDCEADADTTVYMIFDELMTGDDIVPRRSNVLDAVKLTLTPGSRRFITFEPYTLRFLKICVSGGDLKLNRVCLIEQAGVKTAELELSDPEMAAIYKAACNTYRQNATDIFMDCPSRERAGWLCDSFFTGRVEYELTGKNTVETNFLENFAYHDEFMVSPEFPKGLVPMLYPGSTDFIPTGSWIPNWCLWLVLEIEEYAHKRGGDPALVSALKDTVYGILGVYKRHMNPEGFAEGVPGWAFVEWSRANDPDVVCGVNYPTNMLFSGALEAAGRTYDDNVLIEEAAVLRERIREYSFNGSFFTDNSVRENGRLVRTANTTEVCQYYAVFFGIADAETHPQLLKTLTRDFGPQRKQNNPHPDVPFANAFIGNYLRLDSLMRLGYYSETAREIAGYFGFMARANGALWEYDTPRASCCHGFASMAAVWIRQLKEKGIIE